MDQPFDVTKWQPTRPPEPALLRPSDEQIAALAQQLQDQTKAILAHPYDPNTWLRRAGTLARLHYPELALGDAWKSEELCRQHVRRLESEPCWRLGKRMGFWMLDESGTEDGEVRERLHDYLVKLKLRAEKMEVDCMCYSLSAHKGLMLRRPYPWMDERLGWRSDGLLDLINKEFEEHAADSKGDACCVVRRHAFGEDESGVRDTSNVLGVFASRDIEKKEVILVDNSKIFGCNGAGRGGDLQNLNGGTGCGDPVHPNLDSDATSLDLRWIRDEVGVYATSALLHCRLLLCCIQDGVQHPLDHPLVARLTPTYRKDHIFTFYLADDLAIPNHALQQFGIDIFANPNFDTWALFTIQARVKNNSCGDQMSDCLSPLFSLINSSCEPNAEWSTGGGHTTVTVTAGRDIAKSEQLFVEYDGFLSRKTLEERRKRLWDWLDADCQCSRCVREEEEQRLQRRDSKVDGDGVPSWDDVTEKVVLPEDLVELRN